MKKYVFKPYSKIFPELFLKEKERIASHLKTALAIEHVGSTAVPHLGGKGIIDIAVAVNRADLEAATLELQKLGYEFRPEYSTPERLYFIIYLSDPEEEKRRYHIHLTYLESNEWRSLIGFRDYLRNHTNEMREYAEIKKRAASEADNDGARYRKLKEPIFKKVAGILGKIDTRKITFKRASLEHQKDVQKWLEEPHVKEFWDNCPEHLEDIIIFMKGRKVPSPYWDGMFDYWIGLIDNKPYSLLMTSVILPSQTDLSELWKRHLSKTGKTFSIDFMIGNREYLGKGLSSPTLEAFTKFFSEEVDTAATTFFIDPADSNPRAKHVYEKAGFKNVGTFYRDCHDQKNVRHFLMVYNR